MQLKLMVKLQPNPTQAQVLRETMERFNTACNAIADVAFWERTASQVKLHHLVYYDIRQQFGLSAQMAVRAIGKVAEAYKRDKRIQPQFRAHGAIVYETACCPGKGQIGFRS